MWEKCEEKTLQELMREIEKKRRELDFSFEQSDSIENTYEKSVELDKLLEEYIERTN